MYIVTVITRSECSKYASHVTSFQLDSRKQEGEAKKGLRAGQKESISSRVTNGTRTGGFLLEANVHSLTWSRTGDGMHIVMRACVDDSSSHRQHASALGAAIVIAMLKKQWFCCPS